MSRDAGSVFDRRRLVAALLANRGDALVVAGLGTPAWDLAAAGDVAENFYLWGGMGQAVPIGLGLAMAQPGRRVLVLTGDGEMMMGVGSLAVVSAQAPRNLAMLVLDNELFGETGSQAGLTAAKADLAAIAKGAGIETSRTFSDSDDMSAIASLLLREPGPVFAVAKIARQAVRPAYPSSDGAFLARRMREVLGHA